MISRDDEVWRAVVVRIDDAVEYRFVVVSPWELKLLSAVLSPSPLMMQVCRVPSCCGCFDAIFVVI